MAGKVSRVNPEYKDDVDDLKKIIHKNKLQKHVLKKILKKYKSIIEK